MAFLLSRGFSKSTAVPRLFFLAWISDRHQGNGAPLSYSSQYFTPTSIRSSLTRSIVSVWWKKGKIISLNMHYDAVKSCVWLKKHVLFFLCEIILISWETFGITVWWTFEHQWNRGVTICTNRKCKDKTGSEDRESWRKRKVYCNSLTREKGLK